MLFSGIALLLLKACYIRREDHRRPYNADAMNELSTLTTPAIHKQQHSKRETILRVCAVVLLFVALKAVGNLSLAWGMKHFPQTMSADPLPYLKAMFDPFVAFGVGAFILALLVRMALLSVADLSFVVPVTAIGYFAAAFLGKTFLHESVSGQRWLGTVLIFLGAAVVGSTPHSTTDQKAK
jgi:drug/metabolite transporter (DMT)-like permease